MDVDESLWTSMFFMDVHKEHGIPRTLVYVLNIYLRERILQYVENVLYGKIRS